MAKKLARSNNKMIAGICAGIAEYFGWNTALVRVLYLLLTIFTAFAGAICYVVLWIVMPVKKSSYEERMNEKLHNR